MDSLWNFDYALVTLKNNIQFSNKANAACIANDPNELYRHIVLEKININFFQHFVLFSIDVCRPYEK